MTLKMNILVISYHLRLSVIFIKKNRQFMSCIVWRIVHFFYLLLVLLEKYFFLWSIFHSCFFRSTSRQYLIFTFSDFKKFTAINLKENLSFYTVSNVSHYNQTASGIFWFSFFLFIHLSVCLHLFFLPINMSTCFIHSFILS